MLVKKSAQGEIVVREKFINRKISPVRVLGEKVTGRKILFEFGLIKLSPRTRRECLENIFWLYG